ncbi:transcriptional regulator [Vibrio ishigakensis]|uniref:Transcriptional regulator n=1 Tax=Vibrio ishigakensis TaxID=1481914 RepID=A0A0B8NRK1_9VIBR|nr:LysR substrate-binding domain-containing protein [Vibrio ishigakensis]GAM56566.1 transcriptional regulator [Vibrio ishigakensis]GAM66550.1 transcriptional regulator [Vibrio sp. JCM 19236]
MYRSDKVVNRSLPPLNSLRAFEAAARHLSLSKAASELNVSRGAISQQIKLLERHLNEPLFLRQGSQLNLTDPAIHFLTLLTAMFDNLQMGTQGLFGQNVQQTLTVRISQSFCCAWLLTRLADFQRQNPNLNIKFYSTVNLYPSNEQTCDIEIINGYGNWHNKDALQLTKSEEWVVVASPCFIKRYDFSQAIETISSYPKIATMGYSEGWRDWFNVHSSGMPYTLPVLEFDSTQLSMEAACQGLGMLLAKRILVEDSIKAGDLVIAHKNSFSSHSHHYLIVNKNRENLYQVNQFKQWLLESLS